MLILHTISAVPINIEYWELSKYHTTLKAMYNNKREWSFCIMFGHNHRHLMLSYDNVIEQLIHSIKTQNDSTIDSIIRQHSLIAFLDHVNFLNDNQREYIILMSS